MGDILGLGDILELGVGDVLDHGLGETLERVLGDILELGMGDILELGMGDILKLGKVDILELGQGDILELAQGDILAWQGEIQVEVDILLFEQGGTHSLEYILAVLQVFRMEDIPVGGNIQAWGHGQGSVGQPAGPQGKAGTCHPLAVSSFSHCQLSLRLSALFLFISLISCCVSPCLHLSLYCPS